MQVRARVSPSDIVAAPPRGAAVVTVKEEFASSALLTEELGSITFPPVTSRPEAFRLVVIKPPEKVEVAKFPSIVVVAVLPTPKAVPISKLKATLELAVRCLNHRGVVVAEFNTPKLVG